MMVSPGYLVKVKHENDTFEQLIAERDKMFEQVKALEAIAYDEDRTDEAWHIHPGPDVRYQMSLEYLAEFCNFIRDKYNEEIVWKRNLEEDED